MMNLELNRKIKIIFSWIAVMLWMALIFYLSNQPATQSNKLSGGITKITVKTVKQVDLKGNLNIGILHSSIRDNAHFFLYLVLGVLILNSLRGSGLKGIIMALFICILYAVSDEVHQIFVPGRGAEIKDVLIDSAGAAAGIILYLLSSIMFKMGINIKRTV